MTLRQKWNIVQDGEINSEINTALDCTDLSEMVCLFWDYLITEPCYSLVSISNGYVKRLMQSNYSRTVDELQRAITHHRQALHSIPDCGVSIQWWEHLGEMAALEECSVAVTQELVEDLQILNLSKV